jgi:hypothetical protein
MKILFQKKKHLKDVDYRCECDKCGSTLIYNREDIVPSGMWEYIVCAVCKAYIEHDPRNNVVNK